MTFTNREIRALLRQVFQDPSSSDTEYTHYEMFVNEFPSHDLARINYLVSYLPPLPMSLCTARFLAQRSFV